MAPPGRGPQWDRAIYETMKDVTLADQVEAVRALPALWSADTAVPSVPWTPREGARLAVCDSDATVPQLDIVRRSDPLDCPRPDLDKVAMIGWSYGGFLSALAVLDAPDVVHAACAGAPPTDWTLYDTHYTERYLGLTRRSTAATALWRTRPSCAVRSCSSTASPTTTSPSPTRCG